MAHQSHKINLLTNNKLPMSRPQIYQLMVRHFGNTNSTRKWNGTIEENGCGKFNDISVIALKAIRTMGFTHIWFTGVLEHASGTGYLNRPADPECLLKGVAGSPYAVRDYFDVSPDLAEDVENRIEEFKNLLDRCNSLGLVAIIDFIPNHVARSYCSDVKPEINFGNGDDTSKFFDRDNNFFYLHGEGDLVLPTGEYEPEKNQGRVTGNNASTWKPSVHDWYETVKLNYGHDFRNGPDASHLENLSEVPDTWKKMDAVLAYWQELGVRGFRCDMAHMVPVPFWKWLIEKARSRDKSVYFTGEAYDLDPAKLTYGNILHELLEAGYDSVYDSETYDMVKGIYEHGKWANDIDELLWDEQRLHGMLRYVENHDEVRIASPINWGGHGAKIGMPVTAILLGIGRSANLLYCGQELSEPAIGSEGFCGDEGRTSIFDYWSPPEIAKWVNGKLFDGGQLNAEQEQLRNWYSWWLNLMNEPAFAEGQIYGLNGVNLENPHYGRLDGETYSGHWLYSFIRYSAGQAYLVVANLNPDQTMHDVRINIPQEMSPITGIEGDYKIQQIAPCEVLAIKF